MDRSKQELTQTQTASDDGTSSINYERKTFAVPATRKNRYQLSRIDILGLVPLLLRPCVDGLGAAVLGFYFLWGRSPVLREADWCPTSTPTARWQAQLSRPSPTMLSA